MIERYEREVESLEMVDGKEENIKSFKTVDAKDATHKHICYHDENPPRPCRRIKLK
jgi:hypothetical protein